MKKQILVAIALSIISQLTYGMAKQELLTGKEFPKVCEITCAPLQSFKAYLDFTHLDWDKKAKDVYLYSKGVSFPGEITLPSSLYIYRGTSTGPRGTSVYFGDNGGIIFPKSTVADDTDLLPEDLRALLLSRASLISMIGVNTNLYNLCSIKVYATNPSDGSVYTHSLEDYVDEMVKFDFQPLKLKNVFEQREYEINVKVITDYHILKPKVRSIVTKRLQELKTLGVCK